MKIEVIGKGYVGIVRGKWFEEWGKEVVCGEKKERKIEVIERGIMKI